MVGKTRIAVSLVAIAGLTQEGRRRHQSEHQLSEPKSRLAESFVQRIEMRLIGFRLMPTHRVAENLLDHAAIASRVVSQHVSQLLQRGELRIRNALNMGRGIQIELKFLGPARLVGDRIALQLELDYLLLAITPDVVVLLETESDRIDQSMAARPAFIAEMHRQPLLVG